MNSNFHLNSIEFAHSIREVSLRLVHKAKASHIGSALSIADMLAVLYRHVLRFDPIRPHWAGRDRFILSKGHACIALYCALGLAGYFDIEELESYGDDGSVFMNHASHRVPGVELSTGSLGHGLSYACGVAIRIKNFPTSPRIFVLLSDGELNEGSCWEAIMFANHHKLSNLTAVVDANGLQSLTSTKDTLDMGVLHEKFRAFGWNVAVVDGHDHDALLSAFTKRFDDAPYAIISETTKGKGVPFMENQVAWHYKFPDEAELSQALSSLGRRGR